MQRIPSYPFKACGKGQAQAFASISDSTCELECSECKVGWYIAIN